MMKKILVYLAKQIGYIMALGALTLFSMFVGVYFVTTDSQPQDAAVLTPMITVPLAFIAGVLLHKVLNRKKSVSTPE